MPDFEGKPIRMRGYYRAVKRGVAWAVAISKKKGFDFALAISYRNVDFKPVIYSKNAGFFKMIPKDKNWNGAYIPIPFKK